MDITNESRIIVHHFARTDTASPPTSTLLDEGCRIVHSIRDAGGWTHVNPLINQSFFETKPNSYVYAVVCPVIASTPGTAAVIPDWDTRRDAGAQMELIRTEDLEDFESTDLSSVSVATRLGVQSRLPSVSIVHQEIACLVTNHQPQPRINRSSSPPRKRRRYMPIAIDKMIPLPHYHGILSTTSSIENNGTKMATFFPKSTPQPIPPHDTKSIPDILGDQYTRHSWVIPVRGTPPWIHCTGAIVIPDDSFRKVLPSPASLSAPGYPSQVTWTKDSLQSFWNFLLCVRTAFSVGPLALSFHCAFETSPSTSTIEPQRILPDSQIDTPMSEAGRSCGTSILDVDHIKVYHDSPNTIGLRNVLNAWSFEYTEQPIELLPHAEQIKTTDGGAGGLRKKIRVLRGARLVLLDERGRGLMTC